MRRPADEEVDGEEGVGEVLVLEREEAHDGDDGGRGDVGRKCDEGHEEGAEVEGRGQGEV